MKNLAIIPARSGSKGLKDKNIKLLNGKPLIAYTIEAAIKSKMFDEVMVSTDSEEYADIAKKYGANVPFMRNSELSNDTASSWDVVRDVFDKYKEAGKEFDTVALLQPTSPLRTAEDIIDGYKIFNEKNANAIVAVCEVEHSPLWCNTLPDDLSMEKFIRPEILGLPRQSIPKYYRINGAIYIVKTEYFKKTKNIYSEKSFAFIMKKENSVDIDDEFDYFIAGNLLKKNY